MNIVIKQEQLKDYKITEEVVKNGKTYQTIFIASGTP